MTALSHVCLSDLHLGAGYSILTGVNDDGAVDVSTASPSLQALGHALAQQVAMLGNGKPPTLILLGDVLDMGLSPIGEVIGAYRRFVEALFPAGQPAIFSDQVMCVPGNHDHHLWRAAQDERLLELLEQPGTGEAELKLLAHTHLCTMPRTQSRLLTRVMNSYPHLANARVTIAYPNYGLLDETSGRCVVLHHGHYTDSLYLAMSTLNGEMSGSGELPGTVGDVERQNGAWVDFLWSDLGDAGEVGGAAGKLYQIMRDAAASHRFSEQVGYRLLDVLASKLGIGPGTQIVKGVTVSNLLRGLIGASIGRAAESERNTYLSLMSADGMGALRWYVGGPVRAQLAAEDKLQYVKELSFIFGHSHKPFSDDIVIPGWALPVSVYNTGGWVMDQPTLASTQGAAVIFIDSDLNIAAQRLFNDPLNGECPPVQVRGTGGFRDRDNPLLERVTATLAQSAESWALFSACAQRDILLRADWLLSEFFDAEHNRRGAGVSV